MVPCARTEAGVCACGGVCLEVEWISVAPKLPTWKFQDSKFPASGLECEHLPFTRAELVLTPCVVF